MQTITTKYLPETLTKPGRVKATSLGGTTAIVVDNAYSAIDHDENGHVRAAKALKAKLNWSGPMQGGSIKGGMVFVFISDKEPVI